MKDKRNTGAFFLRLAIAIPFLYAAIAAFIDPTSWVGFLPSWTNSIIPVSMALILFSVYEIGLSLWLISGKEGFYSALLSAITLGGITFFNLGALDIVFRDVGLFLAAVALVLLEYKR